jgi:murein DD-endopeptidase MepM/ murein hydrolase activator NlpD
MKPNPYRRQILMMAVGVLFLVVLACSAAEQAPVQTAVAAAAQTALAEGKKAAGTEAVHLLETGQAAGGTAAVSAFGTLNAQIATEAANAMGTLNPGPIPQFQVPVSGAGITMGPLSPEQGDHTGPDKYAIDYLGPEGSPIQPTLAGEVVFSDYVDDGYGYAVAIYHMDDQGWGTNYYSIYTHLLNKDLPAVGTKVDSHTIIGYMGSSGTDVVHLHFAVRTSDKVYAGTAALYGQSKQTSPPTIYTPAYNVRAQFGLNP